jgi:hypothetical protein
MPNWCSDKLTIIGPGTDVQAFKTKAVGDSPWEEPEEEPDVLNFHSLVPVLWRSAELTHPCSTKLTQWFKAGDGAFSFQVVESVGVESQG